MKKYILVLILFASIGFSNSANAQTPYIAEIKMFGGNFAPRDWAFCDGQLLAISQNTALFSILGTTYGGDGQTTFALPDLRGRVVMQPGTGPGLSTRQLGQRYGSETSSTTGIVARPNRPGNTRFLKSVITDNSIVQPYTGVNYIIALFGVYPSQTKTEKEVVSVEYNKIDGVSLYPNPVNDKMHLSASNKIEELSVFNLLGQEVHRNQPNVSKTEIDMTNLPIGMYVVKVQAGDKLGSYRIVKE